MTGKIMAEEDCSINLIYKLSEDVKIEDKSVFDIRYKLGEELSKKYLNNYGKADFDMICPVPNTGRIYARGFADAVGIPYMEAIVKLDRIRTLHIDDSEKRRNIIKHIISISESTIFGKKICLIDEAIFTGTTLKIICKALRSKGAENITILIPTPLCIGECCYNIFGEKHMLCEKMNENEACRFLGADRLMFQSYKTFKNLISCTGYSCTDCFKCD